MKHSIERFGNIERCYKKSIGPTGESFGWKDMKGALISLFLIILQEIKPVTCSI